MRNHGDTKNTNCQPNFGNLCSPSSIGFPDASLWLSPQRNTHSLSLSSSGQGLITRASCRDSSGGCRGHTWVGTGSPLSPQPFGPPLRAQCSLPWVWRLSGEVILRPPQTSGRVLHPCPLLLCPVMAAQHRWRHWGGCGQLNTPRLISICIPDERRKPCPLTTISLPGFLVTSILGLLC